MNDMNRFLFTEDELKAFVPNTDGAEKEKGRGLFAFARDAAQALGRGAVDAVKGAWNNGDIHASDIPAIRERQKKNAEFYEQAKSQLGEKAGEIAGVVAPSLGYSASTLGASLLGGAATGAAAGSIVPGIGTIAGALGGMAASGTMAYRAAGNDFFENILVAADDSIRRRYGRSITEEEAQNIIKAFKPLAKEYGSYEALPEAIGNIFIGGFGSNLAKSLIKGTGKKQKIGRFAAGAGLDLTGEIATETTTEKAQSGVEATAGLGEAKSIGEAFSDVAAPTAVQAGILGGLVHGGRAAKQRLMGYGDRTEERHSPSEPQSGVTATTSEENPYRHRDLLSEDQAPVYDPEVVNEIAPVSEQQQAGRTRATVFDTAPSGAAAGEVDLLQIGGPAALPGKQAIGDIEAWPEVIDADAVEVAALPGRQAIEGATEQRPALGAGLVGLSPNGQQDTTAPVAPAGNDMEAAVTPEVVAEVQGTTQQDELADELFRQYQAYRTAQEMRGREPLSFDAWGNGWEEDTEVVDTGAVNVEPARSIDGGMNAGLVGMAPQPAGLTEGMASSPEMTHAALTDTAMPEAAAADVRAVSPETALQGEMIYGRPEQGDGRGPADTVAGQEVNRGSEPAGYAGRPAGEAAVPEQAGGQGRGGRYAALKIPNRDDLPVQFEVVERDEVQPSHLPARDFERNPRYGLENERRYHDEPASRDKVVGNAKNLDPAFLLESVDANQGAPVVDREGNVLGGNGRAMSISLSYDRFRDKAEGYRQALIDNAARLGLDENAIRSMSAPVLVRRVQGELSPQERQALVSALNEDFKASRERRAEGKSRGDRFSRETLVALSRAFREADSLRSFFDTENSRAIVDRMIRDGVISETERNALVGADGLLNPDGKRVVEEALRGRIAPDYETLSRLPAEVVGKLDAVLPDLIRCEYAGEDWNVTGDMRTALKHIADFKASGIAELQTFLEQADMFTGRSRAQDLNMRARTLLEALLGDGKKEFVRKVARYAGSSDLSGSGNALPGMIKSADASFREAFGKMYTDKHVSEPRLDVEPSDRTYGDKQHLPLPRSESAESSIPQAGESGNGAGEGFGTDAETVAVFSDEKAKGMGLPAGGEFIARVSDIAPVDKKHGEHFRANGFANALDMIRFILDDVEAIYKAGGQSYHFVRDLGDARDKKGTIVAEFEFKKEGNKYRVTTVSPYRPTYFKNKTPLWEKAPSSHSEEPLAHISGQSGVSGKSIPQAGENGKEAGEGFGTVDKPDMQAIAEHFKAQLLSGRAYRTIGEARQEVAKPMGAKLKDLMRMAKEIDEAIELGVVKAAREIVRQGKGRLETYRALVDLYQRQPNLGVRTSTSIAQQAYSTPVPLAYLADVLAGVDENTRVYEPTAGNGALLLTAQADNAVVNELNGGRAARLRSQGFTVTEHDAVAYSPDERVDAVVANPPFGTVKDKAGKNIVFSVDGFATTELDQAIMLNALNALKADGRAAIIIGGKMGNTEETRAKKYNTAAQRKFYKALFDRFNVVEHLSVSGDLYSRQGAKYPVDILIIDGHRPTENPVYPAGRVPRVYNSYEELEEVINEVPAGTGIERTEPGNPRGKTGDRRAGRGGTSGGEGTLSNPAQDGAGRGGRAGSAGRMDSEPEQRGVLDAAGVQPGRNPVQPAGGKRVRPADGEHELSADTGRDADGGRGGQFLGMERADRGADADGGRLDVAAAKAAEQPSLPKTEKAKKAAPKPKDTATQAAYTPSSSAFSLGTLVPNNMAMPVNKALESICEAHGGNIDDYVTNALGYESVEAMHEAFAGEQVDALGMALHNMEQGKGFILGDQTGIGKGRVCAGVIRWAKQNGKIPVFVTMMPDLYVDMLRDLNDTGTAFTPFLTNKNLRGKDALLLPDGSKLSSLPNKKFDAAMKELRSGKLPDGIDGIFTTYSQISGKAGKDRQNILKALNSKIVFILDEAHNAGGASSDVGDFFRTITKSNPNGILYSSATYAKRPDVMGLYNKTDLSLVGSSQEELEETMSAGGLAMQQVVSAQLTESGQYIRREKSFDGATMDTVNVDVDLKMADSMADNMRAIMDISIQVAPVVEKVNKKLRAAGKTSHENRSTGETGASSTSFSSVMHNLVAQTTLAIKADAAVAAAKNAIANGQKPIITLSNTMGSFIAEYARKNNLKSGDEIKLTFGDMFKAYLRKSLEVTLKNADGSKEVIDIRTYQEIDSSVRMAIRKASDAIEKLIDSTNLTSLPISPIDYIIDKLEQQGVRAGEITGREAGAQYREDGKVLFRSREAGAAVKVRASSGFNGGDLDCLVINRAGSTGISLHASEKFFDKRRRNMIIMQPDLNIDVFMQTLGRVFRTGQVIPPTYQFLLSNMPSEKRPAAVLGKKMASLNANTTASAKGTQSFDNIPDFLNMYGDQAAYELLSEEEELNRTLGYPLDAAKKKPDIVGLAAKMTGKIPLLRADKQAEVYDRLEDLYRSAVELAEANGTNGLNQTTRELDAKKLRSVQLTEKKGGEGPFSAPSFVSEYDVKVLGKPFTSEEVEEHIRKGKTPNVTELREKATAYLTKHLEGKTEKAKKAINDKVSAQFVHVRDIVEDFPIGTQVSLSSEGNLFEGFVTNIIFTDKKKGGNPVTPSAWKLIVDISDAKRQIAIPVSKLVDGKGKLEGGKMAIIHNGRSRDAMLKRFDEAQTASRERRYIVTGNLVEGYNKMEHRGDIVSFRNADGTVEMGIVLPKNMDVQKYLNDMPVQFRTAELAVKFLDSLGYKTTAVLGTGDGFMRIVGSQADQYRIYADLKKSTGGRYYLDEDLQEIIGGDFTKSGREMRSNPLPARTVRDVLEYLYENSVVVNAPVNKEAARAVTGENVDFSDQAALASLRPSFADGSPYAALRLTPETRESWYTTERIKDVAPLTDEELKALGEAGSSKLAESSTSQFHRGANLEKKILRTVLEVNGRGMSVQDVRKATDALMQDAANAANTVVVQSYADLPKDARKALKKAFGEKAETIEGVYYRGTAYMVADNIRSAERAVQVWMHEQVGHGGFETLMPAREKRQLLNRLFMKIGGRGNEGLRQIAAQYNLDLIEESGRQAAMREYLAQMAEKETLDSKERTIWQRVWKHIADTLKKLFYRLTGQNVKIGEMEVRDLLEAMKANVRAGKGAEVGSGTGASLSEVNSFGIPMRNVTVLPDGVTWESVQNALKALRGIDLFNELEGEYAQVNATQARKMTSEKAIDKSKANGFASREHGSAVQAVRSLWRWAAKTGVKGSKGDAQSENTDRYAAAVRLPSGMDAFAWITVKDTNGEKRIYSIELMDKEKLDGNLNDATQEALQRTPHRAFDNPDGNLKGWNRNDPSALARRGYEGIIDRLSGNGNAWHDEMDENAPLASLSKAEKSAKEKAEADARNFWSRPREILRAIGDVRRERKRNEQERNATDVAGLLNTMRSAFWLGKDVPHIEQMRQAEIRREEFRAKMTQDFTEPFVAAFKRLNAQGVEYLRNITVQLDRTGMVDPVTDEVTRAPFSMKESKFIMEPVTDEEGNVLKHRNGKEVMELVDLNEAYYRELARKLEERANKEIIEDAAAFSAACEAYVAQRKAYDSMELEFLKHLKGMKAPANLIDEVRQSLKDRPFYFPHMRFGNRYIQAIMTVQGDDGKKQRRVVERIHFDALTDTMADALSAQYKKALLEQYPGAEIQFGTVNRLPEEAFTSAPKTADIMAILNRALQEAEKNGTKIPPSLMDELARASADVFLERGIGQRQMKRSSDFIAGFQTENLMHTMLMYASGLAGAISKYNVAREFTEIMGNYAEKHRSAMNQREVQRTYRWMKNFATDMLTNSDWLDMVVNKVKSGLYIKYLGLNIKSAVVNLTQNPVMGLPLLYTDMGGVAKTTAEYARSASKVVLAMLSGMKQNVKGLTRNENDFLNEFWHSQSMRDTYNREVRGIAGGSSAMMQKVMAVIGAPMEYTERFNRLSFGLAVYRAAMDGKITNKKTCEQFGMAPGTGWTHRAAVELAKVRTREAHGGYGKFERPEMYRHGDLGRLLNAGFTFRSIQLNNLELWNAMLRNMGPEGRKAFALSMASLFTLGGAVSIPLLGSFATVGASALSSLFGGDDDPEKFLKKHLGDSSGGMAYDWLMYGTPALAGTTIKGSLETGVPFTEMDTKQGWVKGMVIELVKTALGASYSIGEQVERAMTGISNGRVRQGVEYLLPSAIANISKAERLYNEGEYTLKGRKVVNEKTQKEANRISGQQAALQAIGFANLDNAKRWDKKAVKERVSDMKKEKQEELLERFMASEDTKDMRARHQVVQEWKAWNKAHPDSKIEKLPTLSRRKRKAYVRED